MRITRSASSSTPSPPSSSAGRSSPAASATWPAHFWASSSSASFKLPSTSRATWIPPGPASRSAASYSPSSCSRNLSSRAPPNRRVTDDAPPRTRAYTRPPMATHPLAGTKAPQNLLIDVPSLLREYHDRKVDLADPNRMVAFGTSGHRGTPTDGTFTESHILAIAQAICEYRKAKGIAGPLFMGKDTHAL